MAYPDNIDARIAQLEAQIELDLANGLNSPVVEILEKLKNIRQSTSSTPGGSGPTAAEIGTAVNGTPITGQTLETGGAGGSGWLSSIRKIISDRLPPQGQAASSSSLPVVLPTTQVTALTPPTSVGISGTLPAFAATPTVNIGTSPAIVLAAGANSIGSISNTAFTANAGTNLNTSALALESGGNLAGINAKLPSSLGAKTGANSLSVVPASDGFAITNTGVGLPNDAVATSPTGNFSLVSLAKRDAARRDVTLINIRSTITLINDTSVVNAPGAGLQFAIRRLRVQNADNLDRSILIKGGAAVTVAGAQATIIGTGLSEVYDASNELVLPENTALVVNLSVAGSVTASIGYYVRSVATGLPV